MPPVLDVALGELAGRGPQQLLPRQVRPCRRQRHDVLELVAEAVRAARLVERRPRPEPAGQRLVEQPAVEQDVHRPVGRPDLDRGHQVVPPRPHRAQRRRMVGRSRAPMSSAAALAPSASPSRTTTCVRAPSASSKPVCRAAQGSRPGPDAPAGRWPRSSPAGRSRAPLRPRNSVRSASRPSGARRGRGTPPCRRTPCSTRCGRGSRRSPRRGRSRCAGRRRPDPCRAPTPRRRSRTAAGSGRTGSRSSAPRP